MKNCFLIAFCLIISISSCSSDDEAMAPVAIGIPNTVNSIPQESTTGNYFPLSTSNVWNYDIDNTDNETSTTTESTDELKVETVNTDSYTLSVNNNTVANGTLNTLLVSGDLKVTNTQLTATGSLDIPIGTNLSIPFTDAKFYDTTKSINEVIYTKTDVINQNFNNIPLTISYTLSSTQLENLDSYTSNGVTYTNVTSARINLNVFINATVTIIVPTTLPIIDPQNVLVIDAFYADGIGLVYAEAKTNYAINATTLQLLTTAGINLGNLPASLSVTNTQTIDTYTVN